MAFVQLEYSNLALALLVVVSNFVIVKSFLPDCKDGGRAVPPSPPAWPVIGNLHQLGLSHHHRKLQALAQRHGPLFLRLVSVPTVVVSSASMAEEVLKTQDHVFCGRPQQCTGRGILYDCRDIGFCPYGERWRQLRRIAVVHLLNVKRVDSFRALREEEVASLVERIRAASAAGLEDGGAGKLLGVNVSELIVGLTYTVISRAAFGNKLGVVMEPGKVREMMEEVVQLLQTISVSDVFPRLWWVDWAMGLDARTKRLASRLDDVFEEALREHEKSSGNDGEAAGDLLDDMLTVMKEGGEGFHLDRVDVKGLIFDLFVGGTDNLQVDRVDNGRARQEPKRNGESASRGETCCWGTRRSARGAAGGDEPTASGHERSHAVTSNGAAAGPL